MTSRSHDSSIENIHDLMGKAGSWMSLKVGLETDRANRKNNMYITETEDAL